MPDIQKHTNAVKHMFFIMCIHWTQGIRLSEREGEQEGERERGEGH